MELWKPGKCGYIELNSCYLGKHWFLISPLFVKELGKHIFTISNTESLFSVHLEGLGFGNVKLFFLGGSKNVLVHLLTK